MHIYRNTVTHVCNKDFQSKARYTYVYCRYIHVRRDIHIDCCLRCEDILLCCSQWTRRRNLRDFSWKVNVKYNSDSFLIYNLSTLTARIFPCHPASLDSINCSNQSRDQFYRRPLSPLPIQVCNEVPKCIVITCSGWMQWGKFIPLPI